MRFFSDKVSELLTGRRVLDRVWSGIGAVSVYPCLAHGPGLVEEDGWMVLDWSTAVLAPLVPCTRVDSVPGSRRRAVLMFHVEHAEV